MKASCSMFSQILKLIPRVEFERMVKQTRAEYASKGLSSWSQFVAMLFCQLGRAHSLREIEGGLRSCEGKLAHLGIKAPARSSLSYANAHRLSLANCYFRLLLAVEIVRDSVAANRTDLVKRAAVPACQISPGACPHRVTDDNG